MKTLRLMLRQKMEYFKEKSKNREQQEIENMRKATEIMGEISAIVSQIQIGKKDDLQKFLKLKRKCEKTENEVKRYFDYSLIDKLDDLTVEAQMDKEKSNN
ncbi:MAG: hypothetical protein BHV99_05080 [Clostridium sp. 26_21]|nr:MAG: hypothetical protein BHV99_05080 [Clostridium sp. 26_21]